MAPRVGLFVTCRVDLMRPSIGFAAVKLLEDAGCTVEVPQAQTCCGQPAFNSGDTADTRAIARDVIEAFEGFDQGRFQEVFQFFFVESCCHKYLLQLVKVTLLL